MVTAGESVCDLRNTVLKLLLKHLQYTILVYSHKNTKVKVDVTMYDVAQCR